mmetsp:Transcript_41945/g.89337  ORF Transcript_41945/g.89337 Transcript_41945/m.89337 type:complete len:109 (-) Transcript_41945:19-345(-)
MLAMISQCYTNLMIRYIDCHYGTWLAQSSIPFHQTRQFQRSEHTLRQHLPGISQAWLSSLFRNNIAEDGGINKNDDDICSNVASYHLILRGKPYLCHFRDKSILSIVL